MEPTSLLIASGFLLFLLVTLAAVRYTGAGLTAPGSSKAAPRAKTGRKQASQEETHRWLRFLLVIAAGLAPLQAVCMALDVLKIIDYQVSFPFLAPTLAGVFTVALARWRTLQELGTAGRQGRTALLAALLVINGANLIVYPELATTLIGMSIFIALSWTLGLRFRDRLLGFAGILVVIWFALTTSGMLFNFLPGMTQNVYSIVYLLNTAAGALAVLLPALLLYTLLNAEENRFVFSLRLLTALLLLGIAIYWAYASATTATAPYLAAAEYHPFTQLLAVTLSSFLLATYLEKRQRYYAPAFAALISMLLILASNLGWITPALAALKTFIVYLNKTG